MQNKRHFRGAILCAILIIALAVVPMLAITVSAESGEWTLVTDASTLKAGDKIVFASNSKGVVAGDFYSTGKYLTSVSATFSSDKNTVTLPSGAMEFTLGGSSGAWTFESDSGKTMYSKSSDLNTSSGTSTWTVSITSAGAATVSCGSNVLQYNSSSPRFKTYTSSQTGIQIYRFEASSCAHTNVTEDIVDATCTEDGLKTVTCNDCGDVTTEKIEKLGHNYVGGTCSRCGEVESAEPKWVLTDVSQIATDDIVVITMTKSDGKTYALYNANGTGSAPTAVAITVSDSEITSEIEDTVKWNISNVGGTLTIYPNGDTSNWLYCTSSNNGVRVGTNANKAFTIDTSSGYLKNTATSRYLGVYNAQDWRCYTNTTGNTAGQTLGFYVYTEPTSGGDTPSPEDPTCEHTNTTTTTVDPTCTVTGSVTVTCDSCGSMVSTEVIPATGHQNTTTTTVDATCTTAGSVTVTCNDCGETVSKTEIPAGHKYVDGFCELCGEKEPSFEGRFYIAAIRSSGNYFYMTNDLGSASTKRYQAADSGLTALPAEITSPEDVYVFVIVKNDDGSYSMYAEGVEGNNYLGWTSGNSGTFVSEANALKLTIDENVDGTLNIHFTASDAERYLALNGTSGTNYFAWYKSGQKQDLTLVPVVEAEPETPAFTGAQVNVGADLAIKYHFNVPEGFNLADFSLRVTNAHGTVTVITESVLYANNTYIFVYSGIAPQCMSDSINAELLYAGEVVDTVADYSIVKNAKNLASADGASAELKQFLADLLAYGKAAQAHLGDKHTVSNVTDDDIAAIGATPKTLAPDESIVETDRVLGDPTSPENAYISGAGVRFDSLVQIYVTVKGADASLAKVKVGDATYDVVTVGNKNIVYLPGMSITQLSAPLTIELYLEDGTESVHTITYGAYAYVYQMISKDADATIAKLAQALYNCAESAKAYVATID